MYTLIHSQINAQVYAFVSGHYMQFGQYPSHMVVYGEVIETPQILAWLTPRQKRAIESDYLRQQLAALCDLWTSTCASCGWNPGFRTEYPNALNMLGDRYAMTDHLRQHVDSMKAMWRSVCLASGWNPELPAHHAPAYPALTA